METTIQIPELVKQKLAAFERIQPEFEECFRFNQAVHGQKRFSSFSVGQVVYYLHALWMCDCKDYLLSIYKNIRRYEGRRCLELLRTWQEGRSSDVVDFLHYKLDMLPFGDLTAQIEEARSQQHDEKLAQRLEHGRMVILNRCLNLMHALDAIFSLSQDDLLSEIRPACEQYGHAPAQIERQLAEMETAIYTYRPHQLLARQNMIVMNRLDVDVLSRSGDQSGKRSEEELSPTEPLAPFAEQVIEGYLPLLAPMYNNVQGVRFVDQPGL